MSSALVMRGMGRLLSGLPAGRPVRVSRHNAFLYAGLILLALIVVVAVCAPFLVAYPPDAYSAAPLEPPGQAHLLGANEVGQDLFSELVYGARVSLIVAIGAGGAAAALAVIVGTLSGLAGGVVDTVLMRLVDILMAIPQLPLLIVLAIFLGPGVGNVVLLIALLMWVRPARVIRSQVLSVRSRGYIQSSRLMGGSTLYVMFRHVLPAIAPIAVASLVSLANMAVIMEASMGFLGIGDATLNSWGMMINRAINYRGIYLTSVWQWWVLPPGICLSLLILALTMIGTAAESYSNARLTRH